MPAPRKPPVGWCRWIFRTLALVLMVLLAAYALATQTRAVHRLVRDQLADRLASHGFNLVIRGMRGGLFEPLVIEGIRLETPGGLRLSGRRADITFDWGSILLRRKGGWIADLQCDGLQIRSPEALGEAPRPWPAWDPRPWLPTQFHVRGIDLQFRGQANSMIDLRDGAIRAGVATPGHFHARSFRAGYGTYAGTPRPISGSTAWKSGVLYLAGATLPGGIAMDTLALDVGALRRQRVELLLNARWREGSLKGDLAFSGRGTAWHLDGTLAAWNIDLTDIPFPGKRPSRAAGRLQEGRISFRGSTAAPSRADWGLRLEVDRFALDSRRFDSLVLGATASQGSIQLYELALRQGPNTLSARGEAELPDQISAWATLRGSGWIDAQLEDIPAFATLLPKRFHHLEGRGSIRGSIVASKNGLTGELDAAAAPLGIRGVRLQAATASLALAGNALEIRKLTIRRDEDHLTATGAVALGGSNRFRGELILSAAEMGDYERLFPVRGFEGLRGEVNLSWAGDGTRNHHSGAFDATVARLRIPLEDGDATSLPLDGRIEATYSPESLFSRSFELRQGQTALSATLMASPTSLALESISIQRSGKPLLTGNLWLPLDIRGLWQGRGLTRIIDPDGKLYADLAGSGIDLADLLRLTGRNWPVRGKCGLRVTASGTPSQLSAKGNLQAAALELPGQEQTLPPSDLAIDFTADEALFQFNGTLSNQSTRDAHLSGTLPTRIRQALKSGDSLLRTDAPLDVQLKLGQANLAVWGSLLRMPWIETGVARGNLRLSGSGNAPVWSGQLGFAGARIATPAGFDPLSRVSGNLVLVDTTAELRDGQGMIGTAPVRLEGSILVADPFRPHLQLRITGEKVRTAPPGLLFQALLRVNLAIDGPAESARVTGSLTATRADYRGTIRFLSPAAPEFAARAFFPPLTLSPLPAGWELDVVLDAPALAAPPPSSGSAALVLRGTAASPYLLGTVTLAGWPFSLDAGTGASVLHGNLTTALWEFDATNPWMPRFTASGFARHGSEIISVRFETDGCQLGALERSPPAAIPSDRPLAAPAPSQDGAAPYESVRESAIVQFGE